jgi:predicted membrane channel-forming protein YqfA (hemolysin III family)
MRKVKKPEGLISYNTMTGKNTSFKSFKVITYLAAICLCISLLTYLIINRAPVDVVLLRAGGLPYTFVNNTSLSPQVLNHFKLHLHNQTAVDALYEIQLVSEDSSKIVLVSAQNPMPLEKNAELTWHFFVQSSTDVFDSKGQKKAILSITNKSDEKSSAILKDIILVGPYGQ